ncbi:MAG: 3'-5' exoribonuclease [Candidatus Sungbacteria bacterium]|nr:3'-5' exoribonuclease [Candidatus Sungbacteria bacterium]
MHERYISVDTESAGKGNMLSLGACVVADETLMFYRELQPLNDAYDPAAIAVPIFSEETMADILKREPVVGKPIAVLSVLHERGDNPASAMEAFAEWVRIVSRDTVPIFVAFSAHADWSIVDAYFQRYKIENPFGISALDAGSYYMGMAACSYADMRISPDFYPVKRRNTHHALVDAMAQAESFDRMLQYNRGRLASMRESTIAKFRLCMECGGAARYVRHTQFTGNHYFCVAHARQEDNFMQEDPSYYWWEELA